MKFNVCLKAGSYGMRLDPYARIWRSAAQTTAKLGQTGETQAMPEAERKLEGDAIRRLREGETAQEG